MNKNGNEKLFSIVFMSVGGIFTVIGIMLCVGMYKVQNVFGQIDGFGVDYFWLLFPLIGILFFSIGFLFLFFQNRGKRLLRRLKSNGDLVYAKVIEVSTNTSYSVNGVNPYVIKCEWMSPYDGKKYIFKSENLWEDPTDIIEEKLIREFPVYITRGSVKPYVIDLDVLNGNSKQNIL